MRPLRHALSLAALLASPPAAAQLANHGIAVESGISAPLARGAAASPSFALSASTWLEGALEGYARVAFASARGTGGRGADSALSAALGLRLSGGPAGARPQLFAEVGWARVEAAGAAADRLVLRIGAALEWFPARDLSLAPRAALRTTGSVLSVEGLLAAAAYF